MPWLWKCLFIIYKGSFLYLAALMHDMLWIFPEFCVPLVNYKPPCVCVGVCVETKRSLLHLLSFSSSVFFSSSFSNVSLTPPPTRAQSKRSCFRLKCESRECHLVSSKHHNDQCFESRSRGVVPSSYFSTGSVQLVSRKLWCRYLCVCVCVQELKTLLDEFVLVYS